jgi:phenylalanyl-tRNA synthetase beta chain
MRRAIGTLAGGLRWEQGGPDWLLAAKRGQIYLGKEGNQPLGVAGQLAKRIADKLKFRQDVYLAEIDLGPLYCMFYGVKNQRRFEPLPRFPGVERDFSLFLADGVTFAQVKKTIDALNIREITSTQAVDLFRGKNVPAGKYSLLIRVTFQSRESTFTESQINEFSTRIVAALEKELGASLRAS